MPELSTSPLYIVKRIDKTDLERTLNEVCSKGYLLEHLFPPVENKGKFVAVFHLEPHLRKVTVGDLSEDF